MKFNPLLIVAICLTLALSASPALAVEYYYDHVNNYTTLVTNNDTILPANAGQPWNITSNLFFAVEGTDPGQIRHNAFINLTTIANSSQNPIYFEGTQFQDFGVSTLELRLVTDDSQGANDGYGFQFYIAEVPDQIYLYKWTDGVRSTLDIKNYQNTTYLTNSNQTFQFIVDNGSIEVWVNGNLDSSATDFSYDTFAYADVIGTCSDGTPPIDDYCYFENLTITNESVTACIENWVCNGYDTASCLVNDTSTAMCNSVTDTNACGTNYTGDYTEFENQTGVCDYCTPNFVCDGYGAYGDCQIDDTQEASCNSTNDTNGCFAITGLPADQYSGNYSEFANATQACDYCTPDWTCDGYINSTCVIVNGTGSLTQTCNSALDNNGCYALTLLPSDQYLGNYTELGQEVLACDATIYAKSQYSMDVLIALLPLIIICGSCLVFFGLYFSNLKSGANNVNKLLGAVVLIISVLLLIALL